MSFSSLKDFFTKELKALVSDESTPLMTVLSLPYIMKSARCGFDRVSIFFSKHSEELLDLTFSDEADKVISSNSFSILMIGDERILMPLFDNGLFLDIAAKILTTPNVPASKIGRLVSLMQVCFSTLQGGATESCGFIYRLLPFCGNPSVFNFFGSICGEEENFESTQHWLNEIGFAEYIFLEFENVDFSYVSKEENVFKDPVFNLYLCLYQLISKCCENEILKNSFLKKKLVTILKHDFDNPPDFLKTARWNAIKAATCKDLALPLLIIIPDALEVLTENFTKLKSYHVSALEFITKMMILENATYDLLIKSSMPQLLITLVVNFEYSTILHSAFLNFVEIGLKHKNFAENLVMYYTPVVVNCSFTDLNRVLKPCFIKTMQLLIKKGKKDKKLKAALRNTPGYKKFVDGPMEEYLDVIKSSYGGEAPGLMMKKLKGFFT
ncbi:hypothetical protein TRFO_41522 [Tritrichomonas foetus]|uniref:Uncharacterized protein n=1 Tax=Tritrichomonas foetus TaxID=1144522 RepID=A0A1J4L063_9EUKA|nr:hypothetical protein TRFO_41522 [Tritrichomonas foetus]|eukprot:OHT16859.1 hypothetical protein TRFO_41522 [Tritrichomonas foetus]